MSIAIRKISLRIKGPLVKKSWDTQVGFAELKETANDRADIGRTIIGAPIVGQQLAQDHIFRSYFPTGVKWSRRSLFWGPFFRGPFFPGDLLLGFVFRGPFFEYFFPGLVTIISSFELINWKKKINLRFMNATNSN